MNIRRFALFNADPGAAGGGAGAAGAGGAGGAGAGAAAGAAGAAGAGAAGAGTAAGGAGQAAPAPFWKGFYADDGKIDKATLDRLPDHLKEHKDLFSRYESVDALLSGFGNASKLASKKQLTPLDANAPEHVRAERKALLDGINNVPKEAKGYGVARPENFPEEHWDAATADKFAAIAHKHSLTPDAVKELLGLQMESTNASLAKGQEMETAYYREQDAAFAKGAQTAGIPADRATELAQRGAATLGIDPKSPIFKNADVRLACMRMNALVSEDKIVTGDAGGGGGGAPDYRAQARDIMANTQNPLHKAWADGNDPRHEEAKEKVNQLYALDADAKRKRGQAAP